MKTIGKMSDVNTNARSDSALREVIRKELASETNRRFLARMPVFRPQGPLPDQFLSLLGELDRAEKGQRAR